MKTNYYNDLEVGKDATQDEIKKSYRKLSKQHHPDKGGDEKKFAAISEAYEALSNPAKRKEYDETGTVKKKPNHLSYFCGLVSKLFVPMIHHYRSESNVDIIKKFVEEMSTIKKNMLNVILENQEKIDALEKSKEKITVKSGENFLSEMIQVDIDRHKSTQNNIERELESLKWSLKYMEDYEYKVTKEIGSMDWDFMTV